MGLLTASFVFFEENKLQSSVWLQDAGFPSNSFMHIFYMCIKNRPLESLKNVKKVEYVLTVEENTCHVKVSVNKSKGNR